jgi:hypothetical protein
VGKSTEDFIQFIPKFIINFFHFGSIRLTELLPHFGQDLSCGTFGVYLDSYSCPHRRHLNVPVSAISALLHNTASLAPLIWSDAISRIATSII